MYMLILYCFCTSYLHLLVNDYTASSLSPTNYELSEVFHLTMLRMFHREYVGVDICQLIEMKYNGKLFMIIYRISDFPFVTNIGGFPTIKT